VLFYCPKSVTPGKSVLHRSLLVSFISFIRCLASFKIPRILKCCAASFVVSPLIIINKPIHFRWKSKKFCRGSYTSIAVGASQIDIEQIAQPLFAGSEDEKVFLSILFLIFIAFSSSKKMCPKGDQGPSFARVFHPSGKWYSRR